MNRGRKITISGRVQGVFFRYYTQKKARSLGLRGKVRNCIDGRVELWAYGPEADLDKLQHWCHDGSPASWVEEVYSENIECKDSVSDFIIER
jgi:acylphosphatase